MSRTEAARSHAPYERKDAGSPDLASEIKKAVDPLMSAFEEYKKTNEQSLAEIKKNGAADPLTVEKLGKLEAKLASYENLNQAITTLTAQAKAAQEAQERLEAAFNRPGRKGGSPEENRAEYKSRVNLWARGVVAALQLGEGNVTDDQRKALLAVRDEYKAMSVTDDTTGGYLAPKDLVTEIIKGITLFSPVRTLARVRTTSLKSLEQPRRTGQFAARRTTEQGSRTETTGLAYGMIEIPAPEMYAMVDISQQNLEDSAYDLEGEVNMEASEQFAVKEGSEFVSGTGIGECEGILTNADVSFTVSGAATTIADANGQANGIIDLKHAIKSGYARNARWAMNRTTLGSVRKLKDLNNQYIWMPGIQNAAPATIDGDPYVEVPDMPSEGAGTYPIAYGDFQRAYVLVDRIIMQMLRDPYTQAASGNIRLWFRRRVGGKVVLAEAIRKLKCST
jgi:HK97 family phage major capsid protein